MSHDRRLVTLANALPRHSDRPLIGLLAAALCGACGALNYTDPDGPRYSGSVAPSGVADTRSLRVVTFNIRYGEQPDRAFEELEAAGLLDADVFALQEVDAAVSEDLGSRLGTSWVYYPASVHHERDFGNAILSRWPMSDDHKVVLPHRAPLDGRARIAVSARIEGPRGPLFIASVHNETVVSSLPDRLDQARAVIEACEALYPGVPGVVAGDFNTFGSGSVSATVSLHDEYGFEHAAPRDGVATAETVLGPASLDHIFVRGLSSIEWGVAGSLGASDHGALWVEVAVGPGP